MVKAGAPLFVSLPSSKNTRCICLFSFLLSSSSCKSSTRHPPALAPAPPPAPPGRILPHVARYVPLPATAPLPVATPALARDSRSDFALSCRRHPSPFQASAPRATGASGGGHAGNAHEAGGAAPEAGATAPLIGATGNAAGAATAAAAAAAAAPSARGRGGRADAQLAAAGGGGSMSASPRDTGKKNAAWGEETKISSDCVAFQVFRTSCSFVAPSSARRGSCNRH